MHLSNKSHTKCKWAQSSSSQGNTSRFFQTAYMESCLNGLWLVKRMTWILMICIWGFMTCSMRLGIKCSLCWVTELLGHLWGLPLRILWLHEITLQPCLNASKCYSLAWTTAKQKPEVSNWTEGHVHINTVIPSSSRVLKEISWSLLSVLHNRDRFAKGHFVGFQSTVICRKAEWIPCIQGALSML